MTNQKDLSKLRETGISQLVVLLNRYNCDSEKEYHVDGDLFECINGKCEPLEVNMAMEVCKWNIVYAFGDIQRDHEESLRVFEMIDKGWKFAGYDSYGEYLRSPHWKWVRKDAIDRAGGLCMLCNTADGGLHVHHRTYERLGNENAMDIIVLCAKHHAQFHGKGGVE